jgi:hypothetical protein
MNMGAMLVRHHQEQEEAVMEAMGVYAVAAVVGAADRAGRGALRGRLSTAVVPSTNVAMGDASGDDVRME